MKTLAPLQPGVFYHIYNRGNNGEDLFREERNYSYLLKLYEKYVTPIADTYAYCLLKNHFHFLVRIKTEGEIASYNNKSGIFDEPSSRTKLNNPSKNFSNLFNAYTKAINNGYSRTGSLFKRPFQRIPVMQNPYLLELIFYIHFNPQRHGLINDFRKWQWSSYGAILKNSKTRLQRDEVIEIFGSKNAFEEYHTGIIDMRKLSEVIDEY
jgi:putative transposase